MYPSIVVHANLVRGDRYIPARRVAKMVEDAIRRQIGGYPMAHIAIGAETRASEKPVTVRILDGSFEDHARGFAMADKCQAVVRSVENAGEGWIEFPVGA